MNPPSLLLERSTKVTGKAARVEYSKPLPLREQTLGKWIEVHGYPELSA